MYIDHVSRRPTLREATRFDTVQAKNVNVKKLKMIDKQAAQKITNVKHHGGRLYLGRGFGSWFKKAFNKVKDFGKKVFNKVIKPAYTKAIKPGLNFLAKNEIGKQLTKAASDVIGSAVSAIPVVGPIAGPVVQKTLPSVVESADNITTAAENIVQSIKDKNPQLTMQQAKEVVGTIKKTYNALNDEVKKAKEEQTKKAIEALPETIKGEGFESVLKAAPFLPLVDLTTLKTNETTTKGGKIKQGFKIRKPTGADKFGKYSAPIVARVCGRMFMGGQIPQVEKLERVKGDLKTVNDKNMELLEKLRQKYKK